MFGSWKTVSRWLLFKYLFYEKVENCRFPCFFLIWVLKGVLWVRIFEFIGTLSNGGICESPNFEFLVQLIEIWINLAFDIRILFHFHLRCVIFQISFSTFHFPFLQIGRVSNSIFSVPFPLYCVFTCNFSFQFSFTTWNGALLLFPPTQNKKKSFPSQSLQF